MSSARASVPSCWAKTVYGLGRRRTPASLIAACDRFIFLEVLGKGGQTLKWIGQKSREELTELLNRPVHLFLTVKVDPKWQDSRALYAQFGLEFDV